MRIRFSLFAASLLACGVLFTTAYAVTAAATTKTYGPTAAAIESGEELPRRA